MINHSNMNIWRLSTILGILLIPLILIQTSCKKLVEIPPPGFGLAEDNIFTSDATATSVLTALYSDMNTQPFQGLGSIPLYTALSSDELSLLFSGASNIYFAYYRNELSAVAAPVAGAEFWSPLYNLVYKCNAIIEGLETKRAISALTPAVRQQLLGEAKFMRAFMYFYLVNLFGELPLATTTDYKVNTLLARSPLAPVYEQIIRDLKQAQELLSVDYLQETLVTTTTERVRPTKWAATALLARAYLYTRDYIKAAEEATAVINNNNLYELVSSLNNVFLKNSKEAIWQIQPTALYYNTREAQVLVITGFGPNGSQPVAISSQLLNSFEPGDQRATPKNWIDTITVTGNFYRFPYKYKLNTSDLAITASTKTKNMKEYYMVLRLGEQYLIRAEARAQQGNITGAIEDLDKIRQRAGLPLIALTNPGISQAALLDTILHERQVELFTEWGHRWFDLKRTRKVDEVMNVVTPLKSSGQPWQSYQQLYPVLNADLLKAPNLVQNPGY